MAELLQVDGIHAAYGLSQVLFGVSLGVRAGECIALIGRNGVGKDHDDASIAGLVHRPPRARRLERAGYRAAPAASHLPAQNRLRARGSTHLPGIVGMGKPRHRTPHRRQR